MTKFCSITRPQMHEFMTENGFLPLALEGVYELVYGRRIPHEKWPLTLRVYTGIVGEDSRKCGRDAIRVDLFLGVQEGEKDGKPVYKGVYLASSKKVLRV